MPGRRCRRCGCSCTASGRRSRWTARGLPDILYRVEEQPRLRSRGNVLEPGLLPRRPLARAATPRWWPRPRRGRRSWRCGPQRRWPPSETRRARPGRTGRPAGSRTAWAASWCWPPTSSSSRRPAALEDAARARAAGDEVRTVIAGYHWFTDWGRDTMISLEGLTLTTGRHAEAGYILRTFAHHVRDGLIPNLFPEGEKEGLYHTADATLWFFHALDRYLAVHRTTATRSRLLLPKLLDIVEHHLRGTRFGIGVDPARRPAAPGRGGLSAHLDGRQGGRLGGDAAARQGGGDQRPLVQRPAAAGRLAASETGETTPRGRWADQAERAPASFNRRFWYAAEGLSLRRRRRRAGRRPGLPAQSGPGHLADAPGARPSALAARARSRVSERLLTPVGLRSLAPGHPDYKAQYYGDLRARDAAYHQGTVWAWLIGPFIDAWLKVHPGPAARARGGSWTASTTTWARPASARSARSSTPRSPTRPRGCVAQAWSVAEVLRCWVKTA